MSSNSSSVSQDGTAECYSIDYWSEITLLGLPILLMMLASFLPRSSTNALAIFTIPLFVAYANWIWYDDVQSIFSATTNRWVSHYLPLVGGAILGVANFNLFVSEILTIAALTWYAYGEIVPGAGSAWVIGVVTLIFFILCQVPYIRDFMRWLFFTLTFGFIFMLAYFNWVVPDDKACGERRNYWIICDSTCDLMMNQTSQASDADIAVVVFVTLISSAIGAYAAYRWRRYKKKKKEEADKKKIRKEIAAVAKEEKQKKVKEEKKPQIPPRPPRPQRQAVNSTAGERAEGQVAGRTVIQMSNRSGSYTRVDDDDEW